MVCDDAVKLIQAMGKDSSHIDFSTLEAPMAKGCVDDLIAFKQDALQHGFELTIASGYRDYRRQLAIWNSKVNGSRPIRDSNGALLLSDSLSDYQKVEAILYWSALPGTSRHHWGSDFDVYDKRATPENYVLQLTPEECNSVYREFYDWLASYLTGSQSLFSRPYYPSSNSVSSEPWHISHRGCASLYEPCLTLSNIKTHVQDSDILLKEVVLDNLDEWFNKYIHIGAEA